VFFFLFFFFKDSHQSVSEVPSSGILNKLGIIKQGNMSKLGLVPCFLVITVLADPCRSHAIPLVRQMDEDGQNLAPTTTTTTAAPPPPTPAINDTDAIGRLTNEFDDLKDDLTARISSLSSIIATLRIESKFCNGRTCQMCGMCQVYRQYGKSESPSFCKQSRQFFFRKCRKCKTCSRRKSRGKKRRGGSIY